MKPRVGRLHSAKARLLISVSCLEKECLFNHQLMIFGAGFFHFEVLQEADSWTIHQFSFSRFAYLMNLMLFGLQEPYLMLETSQSLAKTVYF
jgi:hypothetical protein